MAVKWPPYPSGAVLGPPSQALRDHPLAVPVPWGNDLRGLRKGARGEAQGRAILLLDALGAVSSGEGQERGHAASSCVAAPVASRRRAALRDVPGVGVAYVDATRSSATSSATAEGGVA